MGLQILSVVKATPFLGDETWTPPPIGRLLSVCRATILFDHLGDFIAWSIHDQHVLTHDDLPSWATGRDCVVGHSIADLCQSHVVG